MKRIAAMAVFGIVSVTGIAPAFGGEKHPPKFGVQDTQCSSGANQPHCPGNH